MDGDATGVGFGLGDPVLSRVHVNFELGMVNGNGVGSVFGGWFLVLGGGLQAVRWRECAGGDLAAGNSPPLLLLHTSVAFENSAEGA